MTWWSCPVDCPAATTWHKIRESSPCCNAWPWRGVSLPLFVRHPRHWQRPDYSPENGNITDDALKGMWLAKFRDYGDTFPKTTTPTLGSARAVTAVGLTITFTGKLQSAPAVTGPWTEVSGAASPFTVATPGKANAFYRAAQ